MELLKVVQTEARGFRLIGEVDLSCLNLLDPIDTAAASGGDLHLDLSRLTFLDGAALDRIAGVARALRDQGRLTILRPQRSVERALRRIAGSQHLDNLVLSRIETVLSDSPNTGTEAELSKVIASDHPPESACRLVAAVGANMMEGTTGASILVRNRGSLLCAAFSSPIGETLTKAQIASGEGPSLDALEAGRRQVTASLVTDSRWPDFAREAMQCGIASVLSQPLVASGSAFGSLTFYAGRENLYLERKIEQAAASLAERGAVVIANSILYWQEVEHTQQLKEALESRAVIDQAKGVLMANEGLSADEAFSKLLKASQQSNLKVRDLAQTVVAGAQSRSRRTVVR